MLTAIENFADPIPLTTVDPTLVISKALTMLDGTVASGQNRYTDAQIALYEFKTGTGTIAYDTSGVEPELDLNLSGNYTWDQGWGVIFAPNSKAQGTTTASAKLYNMITSTGEFSIEAWVSPANVAQTGANIVSYSGGPHDPRCDAGAEWPSSTQPVSAAVSRTTTVRQRWSPIPTTSSPRPPCSTWS